jgi:integrase
MPRKRNPIPSYRLHRQSGNAIVTVYASDGRRRDVLLGKYNTPESKAEYRRILSELDTSPAAQVRVTASKLASSTPVSKLTIAELLCLFLDFARQHYVRPDGSPGKELEDFHYSTIQLRELYDHTLAAEFGPLALKTVRNKMIEAGLSRKIINQRIGRIKFIFKWAVSEELLSPSVYHGLQAVAGLQPGKSGAKETKPVKPVTVADFERTLPYCSKPIAAMLRILRLTGMRPTELCGMKPQHLDMASSPWVYTPPDHKTANRGKERVIYFGPQAQLIIKPYLADCPDDDYVFSPLRERAKRLTELRRRRKTRVQPSQLDRSKPNPQRRLSDHYHYSVLTKNVGNACQKAGVKHWFPYQLRHLFATEVRRRDGLEAAQVLLGHSNLQVTQVYAERNLQLAKETALAMG